MGTLLFLGSMGLVPSLLLLFHLFFMLLGLDLFGFVLPLFLYLFLLSFFTLALTIILKSHCILHFRHMASQQFLFPFPSFNIPLLSLMLPMEILPLPEQGHKEAATILVMRQDPHGVMKVDLLGGLRGGGKHGFFYPSIGILLNFFKRFIDPQLTQFALSFLGLTSLHPADGPLAHAASALHTIYLMDVHQLQPPSYLPQQSGKDGLILDGIEGTGGVHDESILLKEVD